MERKSERCHFIDVTVCSQIQQNGRKHLYKNLTDASTHSSDTILFRFDNIKSPLAIVIVTNGVTDCYVAEITIQELMEIAGMRQSEYEKIKKGFEKRGTKSDDEYASEVISFYCAKKIVDYSKGRVVRIDGDKPTFKFFRERFIQLPNGKRKRDSEPVIVKEFEKFDYAESGIS